MPDSKPTQSDETFAEINRLIQKHLEERDWNNNPSRSIAISIALEASELLEHYQWSDRPAGSKKELADELADVFIYAFQFAHSNQIDIAAAIRAKLEKAAKKNPAEKFKGKQEAERSKLWIKAKTKYKKKGL